MQEAVAQIKEHAPKLKDQEQKLIEAKRHAETAHQTLEKLIVAEANIIYKKTRQRYRNSNLMN
ncbi:hypothetical protein GCM10020331_092160 [Ectobacillus funiculus]